MYIKAQSAMEFILLSCFMLLVLVGTLAISNSKLFETKEANKIKIAEDIVMFAYSEIETAQVVNDGYERTFSMPLKIEGIDYEIKIIDKRELIASYSEYEYVKFLPVNITGEITKGLNKISKVSGVIYLN